MSDGLSKHERRQVKLEQRREQKQIEEQQLKKQETNKKLMVYGGIAIGILVIAGIFLSLPKPEPVDYKTGFLSFPLGKIHWHATPLIYVCGENILLSQPISGTHLGSALLHTHEDSLAHIEGTVTSPSQITIGAFMANVGMGFSETRLLDKTNGDICSNGREGKVRLIVNGTENNEFGNYVLRDSDRLELRFE